ncbi:MAG TPA: DUF6526 family protein [Thermoanaerobaculia bacterium]|jgi:hypothetical protein|nr:DUF6526 family protein [Thermoanaerobaculia bacterium]
MPDEATPQSYANHRRYVPLYHFVTPLILLLNLLWTFVGIYHAWRGEGRFDRGNSVVQVLVAIALLAIWFYARSFALAVQDRLIRQEMSLRLGELLPLDQRARIPALSASQLIALRFASDEELPALTRKVLDEKIESREAIKRLIVNWKGDHQRA